MTQPSQRPRSSFYEEVGGHDTFVALVARFYQNVRTDPILQPLYPEEDFGPAEVRLRMFLEQYWGGPGTYSAQRGHPRLRMRHAPFAIASPQRDAWLSCMRDALDSIKLTPEQDDTLWSYLTMAAQSMVNTPD